jgi:ATP-dependent helicase HrpA
MVGQQDHPPSGPHHRALGLHQREAGLGEHRAGDRMDAHQRNVDVQAVQEGLCIRPQEGERTPADLTARHDDIARAIREHPVVVVAGETGSGKTTQLPKICLEVGRRSIGHTQPRRIAARTVAERVADELGTALGDLVGYQVRFAKQSSVATRLKVMTDGVLLAEIARDRDLRRYDTVIVDEAHERSLNIDFLLGYLRRLLPRRPDLKVIITSATIDTERFAAHFAAPDGTPAPVIEVSGRTYPVEVRYRPPAVVAGEVDQVAAVLEAVGELRLVGDGDILVFLSGEREIRDLAEALRGARLPNTEVLPLYARLSAAEQHRVFAPHAGVRIVLATNVAETSLTVPGIRYVVDPGTARISRYSARTKVQRLPIEPISQASAAQRAGRCGRVAPGVCIRLYSEEDLLSRPEFTEPEILRTNLASVILQMAAARLGAIADFPFVEAPDRSQVADGLRLLTELGALADPAQRDSPRLTDTGQRLAALPVDPRLGRMLVEAERQGCLREMLVIVSGLSIVDPRERPADQTERADALHRRFWTSAMRPEPVEEPSPGSSGDASPVVSDFLAWLHLWNYLRTQRKALSGNAFRRLCRDEHLHFLRIREWQDLHDQLKQITRDLDLTRNDAPATPDRVHTAALAGLLSQIGLADVREEGRSTGGGGRRRRPGPQEYLGARGARFAISPGSSLARTPPPLVVAAELVETSRLWARTVAGITAEQVEEVGQHLLKRQYSEPHWSARSGSVLAYETVTLLGVPIVARRRVGYGTVNPTEAREIFLRSALVEGQWRTRHAFFAANQALRAEVEALEERTRRRDLLVDDETVLAFYAARVPAGIVSAAHFDAWWKRARPENPDLLTMTWDDLTTGSSAADPDAFPETWRVAGHDLALDYVFAPGAPDDGVTVRVPLSLLNQLDPAPFSWQVPGLRSELATELIRSLPKAVRRNFAPAPEFARRALDWLAAHPAERSATLPAALGRALRTLTGEVVDPAAWDLESVPDHLRVGFAVRPDDAPDGEPLATGKDLATLQAELAPRLSRTLATAASALTRTGDTRWEFGTVPGQVRLPGAGHTIVGYPALVDEGATVGLAVLDTPSRQASSHRTGLRRLVLLNTPDPTKWVVSHLSQRDRLALAAGPYGSVPDLLADARLASVGELVRRAGVEVRDESAFRALCDAVRVDNPELMQAIVRLAAEVIPIAGAVRSELPAAETVSPVAAADLTEQLENLVFPGFLAATAYEHLTQLPRYLRAAQQRIAGLRTNPARDAAGLATILRIEDAYAELAAAAPPGPLPDFVDDVGWMIEELRVSLFAQSLRTSVPVSEKRVRTALDRARARLDERVPASGRG